MTYAVLVLLSAGSVALSLWFRHKWLDAKAVIGRLSKGVVQLGKLWSQEKAARVEAKERYEAIIRGHKLEVLRLEKDLHVALLKDPVAAGEYVRHELSVSPEADTTADHYLRDPADSGGGKGNSGGST